jgi:hypothetical protein
MRRVENVKYEHIRRLEMLKFSVFERSCNLEIENDWHLDFQCCSAPT